MKGIGIGVGGNMIQLHWIGEQKMGISDDFYLIDTIDRRVFDMSRYRMG